jgi:glycosyltransferase involved in cell wall biosynthesis
MNKLAIIITHPIQYYVPVFKLLAKQCKLKVFYTWGKDGVEAKHDPGFGKTVEWDLPLLEGYEYELLENTSKNPGSHHGKGIINPNIISKIEDFKPNAILIYGYIYHSHFKVMKYFKGKIPVWFRGDSTLLDKESRLKSILKKLYLNWVYSYVDMAFYVGTNNKAYFKKYGLTEDQLIFTPHAIDNERFAENKQNEATTLRKSLGIDKEDIKNPFLLLESFISLKRKDIHLLFVGNGSLEENLKLKVESLELKNVHFKNFQNQTQMPVIYQACDLFCLPSISETWGLAVNEAMACGKALLVSDKVGCAVDLVDFRNGAVFQSENLVDLSQKLIALTNDQSILKKMGENSLKNIENWSFEGQVNAIATYVNR